MSEKRVKVYLVQITQDAREEGTMWRETTYFCLPGFDYSQTCEALRSARFEQEAIDAKLAETVSVVQITQDTRPAGILAMVGKVTYFRLPGADYNQICAALLAAKFELVDTVQEAIDAKLAEGCNE